MTQAEEDKAKALHQAAQDLSDIATLRHTEAFGRYFIRRLKAKQAAVETKFRNDSADKCSHEEREIRRRIVLAYDEILRMMAEDEATAGAMKA